MNAFKFKGHKKIIERLMIQHDVVDHIHLYDLSGLSKGTVSGFLNKSGTLHTAKAIAAVFKVDWRMIVQWTDVKNSEQNKLRRAQVLLQSKLFA